MADDVQVQFGAAIDGMMAGLARMTSGVQGLLAPFQQLAEVAGSVGLAIGAAFAANKIADFAKEMGELGEKTERTAIILGTTTENVGKINAIAKLTGTSAESLTSAMIRLQRSLATATDASTPVGAALQAIGLRADELRGKAIPQQIEILSDRFSRFGNENGNLTAIASMLGRSFTELLPTMMKGSEEMRKLGEAAERAGTALTTQMAAAMAATDDAIDELGMSLDGLSITLFAALRPSIDGVTMVLTDMVQGFNQSLQSGGTLNGVMIALGATVKGLATAFVVVVLAIQQFFYALNLAAGAVFVFSNSVGAAIDKMIRGQFGAAKDAITGMGPAMSSEFEAFQKNSTASQEAAVRQLNAIWGGLKTDVPGGKPDAPAPAVTDKAGIGAATREMEGELAVLRAKFARQKMMMDADVAAYRMSESEKLSTLRQMTDAEYTLERQLIERKLAIRGLDKAARAQINNELLLLEQKHMTDVLRLTQQAYAERQRLVEGYVNTVESSWNSSLRGMLAGTTSIMQAMKAIVADLIVYWIQQMAKKLVFEQATLAITTALFGAQKTAEVGITAAAEAAKTGVVVTGEATRTAATEAGFLTRMGSMITEALAFIGTKLAEAFAGLVAAFSFLGPLAVPAALGVVGGAGAVAYSMLPGFEQGAYRIPRIMPAVLHPGERVLNAEEAAQSRGERGGGGGGSSFTINAVDAASFLDLIKRNGPEVAKMISGTQKRQPSTRGKW